MKVRGVLWWIVPPLVCLAVFWRGLFCWFQQDDFANLQIEVHSFSDFWRLLLEPRAQGVIRPWGDGFFILFRGLFDLNAFPYRLFVFLTQFVNLTLLAAVVRRLTGSPLAAATASLVWGLNIALATGMAWTSAYSQILCAFFFLAGFLLFLRHLETGRWSYYWGQGVLFLLGFGALEIIVAYPVVLLAYCLLQARAHVWKVLPLLAPSAAYTAVHVWIIPRDVAGPYGLHCDASMLGGLWDYWGWMLAPAVAVVLLLTAGLVGALAVARSEHRQLGIFGFTFFLLTLAPVLPLREQRLDYYLTIPAIGLALMVAAALPAAPRWAVALWLAVYFVYSIPFSDRSLRIHYLRAELARRLLEGAREIRVRHPDKSILLTGVTEDLFYAAIYDEGFRAVGVRDIYLAPGEEGIGSRPGRAPVDHYRLPARPASRALEGGRAVVYEVGAGRLRNITTQYRTLASLQATEPPRRVVAGWPPMVDQLGAGWYQIQGSHRWMSRRAELRLAGPRSAGDRLRVEAIYPDHVDAGPVQLAVSVNGTSVGRAEVRDARSGTHVFPLPASLLGVKEMTVTLETDRTLRLPGDPRDLGLAFGVVELIAGDGRPQ